MILTNPIYIIAVLGSFLLSAILVMVIKKIALKYSVMDSPDTADRKIHTRATPLLGGWAIFLSIAVFMLVFRVLGSADFSLISDRFLAAVFVGGLLIMIGGTLDDKYGLKPWQQILFPLLAAVLVIWAGVQISYITNPFGGVNNAIIYLTPLVGAVVSFIWLMGMMYTTKLLDGLDGLVAGITAIAAMMIFLLSLNWDVTMSATGVWALLLFGSSLGFLVFNWHPAKIFLGDGGSIFVGFMLGVLSIVSGSKIATTLLVIGIPALDVLWVIVRRLIKGQSPFSHGDRKHLHFQLLDIGLGHKEAVLLLYLVATIFGLVAVLSGSLGKLVSLTILAVLMAFIVIIIYIKSNKTISNVKIK